MFGMFQKYSRSYIFTTDGCTLTIEKPMVLKYLMSNNIIKINLLNIVCNRYQQTQRLLCDYPEDTVKNKIVKFLLSYSSIPKGGKEVHIKMTDMEENKIQDVGQSLTSLPTTDTATAQLHRPKHSK